MADANRIRRTRSNIDDTIISRFEGMSESITNLGKLVAGYAKLTESQLEAVGLSLSDIRSDLKIAKEDIASTKEDIASTKNEVKEVNRVVKEQNSRVYKLEEKNNAFDKFKEDTDIRVSHCPGAKVASELEKYKKDMSPVYVISTTNWKFVLVLILAVAFFVKAFPTIYEYVVSELWGKMEIGF